VVAAVSLLVVAADVVQAPNAGFRQFLLHRLDKVRAEWSLVTMAWNLKRTFVLAPA
jgi:hypothetical protein